MYNKEKLDNCRFFIKNKIIQGEIIDTTREQFLHNIDLSLYQFYLKTKKGGRTKQKTKTKDKNKKQKQKQKQKTKDKRQKTKDNQKTKKYL